MLKSLSKTLITTVLLGVSSAQAYTMGNYAAGVLVPYVVHDGPGETTAVGLVTGDSATCPFESVGAWFGGTAFVEWTFFDVDSNPLDRGRFEGTHEDVHSFVWAQEASESLRGVPGYLLFVLDTDQDGGLRPGEGKGACLTAEAFHVIAGENDVAFIPTFPVESTDFAEAVNPPA